MGITATTLVAAGAVVAPQVASAQTQSFSLSSAAVSGQSTVTWQSSPQAWPDPIALNGQIDPTTGDISDASLVLPPAPQPVQSGENSSFTFADSGNATGNYDATTGAVTLTDSFSLTFSGTGIASITCVSSPIDVSFSGTYDPSTEDVTLAASGFTIPQFPTDSGANCSLAASSLNEDPGGVAGSTGNAMSLALNGQFAPGLPTDSTLIVAPSASPQLQGTSVTLSDTVTDPSDAGTPTGTVNFEDNGTSVGTAPLSSGVAALTTTTLPVGADEQLTAVYSGDPNYSPSTSPAVSYTIQSAPTVTAVPPASPITVGSAPATFSVTATNPASGFDVTSAYLQIALSGNLTNTGANRPTIAYQDAGGNWCDLSFTTASSETVYYSGAGTPPCGAETASFALPPGTSVTVPLEISYPSTAKTDSQTMTATLYSGSCTSATSCTATSPLSGSAAPSATGTWDVEPQLPDGPVATGKITAALLEYLSAAEGFTWDVGELVYQSSSNFPAPTGTVSYVVNGTTLGTVSLADEPTYGQTGTERFSSAGLSPGTYTVTADYSGDSVYLPNSFNQTLTVLSPLAGQQYSCTVSYEASNYSFGAVVSASADPLPAAVPSGTAVTISSLDVTANVDALYAPFNPFQSGGGSNLTSSTFSITPSGAADGPGAAFKWNKTTTDASTGSWTDLSTTDTITGNPGDVVPVTLSSFTLTAGSGDIAMSGQCTPTDPTQPVTLGSVYVLGTSVSPSPSVPVPAATPVTANATVYGNPSGSSPTGTVQFYECGPTATATPCTSQADPVGGPVAVTAGPNGTATAPSPTFTPPDIGGYWCLAGYYSGDGNYPASSDTSDGCVLEGPTISSGNTATFTEDVASSFGVTSLGGASPVTYTETGALPPGVTLDPSTGVLGGTPGYLGGQFPITITATDADGNTGSQSFMLYVEPSSVLHIVTTSLPAAQPGVAYSVTLVAAGGTPPYKWSISSPALPKGLKLNKNTGTISGTPKHSDAIGATNFQVQVKAGKKDKVREDFSITVT